MPGSDHLSIEVHFVPLSPAERDDRGRRLRALLLRGALRVVQEHNDREEQAEATLSVE